MLVLFVFLACASSADAQDRVLGLLALPEVFGEGACDRFEPQDVPLRATPEGDVVGVVRVATYWTFHDTGGCEGLEVTVRLEGAPTDRPLPTEEYAYEAPAAVVLEQRDRWFRLRLSEGTAWVLASARDVFHPLEKLVVEGLTFLTPDWDRRLADAPGAAGRRARMPAGDLRPSVRVLGFERVAGALWFQIEVMDRSGCDGAGDPEVVDRGWVAAHSGAGQPVLWFSSRGC